MGTCEDNSFPSITLNLPIHPDGGGGGGGDDVVDPGASPEQVLVQKLEIVHLAEEAAEEEEIVEEEDKGTSGEQVDEKEEEEDLDKDEGIEEEDDKWYNPHPVRPGADDCSYYVKTGACKFGWNCRFNHPLDRIHHQLADVDSQAQPQENDGQGTYSRGKMECKYYLNPGGCKYGDNCRYSHSKDTADNEPAELNFLGLPIRKGGRECPYYMRTGSCGYGASCRFDHPDPVASVEEPKNLVDSSGALQGGYTFAARNIDFSPSNPMPLMPRSISNSSSSEKVSSFVPWAKSLPQGMPQIPGYNPYQVPVPLPDNTLNNRQTRSVSGPPKNADSFGYNQQLMQNEEFPERPGQPECDFFMKTGSCKYRSACKYHHPRSRLHTMPNGVTHNRMLGANQLTHHSQTIQMEEYPERLGQPECTYYMKTGECKYKSACKYHHPKSRDSMVAASTYGMNGLPSGTVPTPSHNLYPGHLNQAAKPFRSHQLPARVEDFPERPGYPECEYFMKTGDCKYRSACRYHHPKGSRSQQSTRSDFAVNEKGLPLRPGAVICRNYEQLGICKFGPRCLYDHPANYDSLAAPEYPSPQSPPGNNAGSVNWEDDWVVG